jgi:hypothetical protein
MTPALQRAQIVGFERGQGRLDDLATGDNDHIDSRRGLVTPENLSYQSFGAVPPNGAANLPSGGDAEAGNGETVRQDEERQQASGGPNTLIVHLAKVRPPLDPLPAAQSRSRGGRPTRVPDVRHSDDTVKRFRPLARRRFSTRRPFLDFMRTRKPCVRRRRRLLG